MDDDEVAEWLGRTTGSTDSICTFWCLVLIPFTCFPLLLAVLLLSTILFFCFTDALLLSHDVPPDVEVRLLINLYRTVCLRPCYRHSLRTHVAEPEFFSRVSFVRLCLQGFVQDTMLLLLLQVQLFSIDAL